jgi:uncharacterized protein
MELNKQDESSHSIESYDSESIFVAGKKLNFPCLVDKNTIKNIDNLENALKDLSCELVIVGSDKNYPIKEQVQIKQIINTEFMNITAAIHSFNLMLSDNRDIALIII